MSTLTRSPEILWGEELIDHILCLEEIPHINWKKNKTKNRYEELGIAQNIFVINPCDSWYIVN